MLLSFEHHLIHNGITLLVKLNLVIDFLLPLEIAYYLSIGRLQVWSDNLSQKWFQR